LAVVGVVGCGLRGEKFCAQGHWSQSMLAYFQIMGKIDDYIDDKNIFTFGCLQRL